MPMTGYVFLLVLALVASVNYCIRKSGNSSESTAHDAPADTHGTGSNWSAAQCVQAGVHPHVKR